MDQKSDTSQSLAKAITRSASKQTYYTIRLLVDRPLVADAYRAYGYFRWVDDILDAEAGALADKLRFVDRQKALLEACYRGEKPQEMTAEEQMLVDLVQHDPGKSNGLRTYLENMMAVMRFDVSRRGRVISQAELIEYSHMLATAVTEAMYYFIGHSDPVPRLEIRYLAVTAAHITHMLRDAFEDTDLGYFNIPGEYLQAHGITPQEVQSKAYRQWVCGRVKLARRYFKASRASHAQIKSLRCRMASLAYTARFEWMLYTIEGENYCLRRQYQDRKSLKASLWMAWAILVSALAFPRQKARCQAQVADIGQVKGR